MQEFLVATVFRICAGYCNIVGRIKDLMIRGGENLYPREIEEFPSRHSKILEVQVFGVTDAKYGEALCWRTEMVFGLGFTRAGAAVRGAWPRVHGRG